MDFAMPRPPNKTNFQLGEAGGVGRVGVGGRGQQELCRICKFFISWRSQLSPTSSSS